MERLEERENHERFMYAFKINRMIIFEVEYGAISSNKVWHFGTCANEFVRNKKDWGRCGQCQESILPKNSCAYKFFKKWDKLHCMSLKAEEYNEIIKDIEELKEQYNYIYKNADYDRHYIPFYELKELSMSKSN